MARKSSFNDGHRSKPYQPLYTSFPRLERVYENMARRRGSFSSKEEYYASSEWLYTRRQKFNEVGHRCERCGRRGLLDVHHVTYENLYDERMEDLQVLCRSCHEGAGFVGDYQVSTCLYRRIEDTIEPYIYDEDFREWLDSKDEEW
jgi:hypothetical protein